MTSRLWAVSLDAQSPERLARFWADLLGRELIADAEGVLALGHGGQVNLRFNPAHRRETEPNRLHLHVTSEDVGQQPMVAKALKLGAHHVDVGQLPDETHVVLGDPENNAFCVIPPDNTFLSGCGRLGEVACEGTREVGLFWRGVLDWPLVWDENEETAVQSPHGGTKLAWGGPPEGPLPNQVHQRFEVVPLGDPIIEIERLVSLGARRIDQVRGHVVLADPDGNEFHLRTEHPLRSGPR